MKRIAELVLMILALPTAVLAAPPAPSITSSLTATGQVGVAFSYQITASHSPTSYGASGLPSGLTVNTSTGLISGTPATGTNAGSPYSVAISATNANGTGSATLTLTIKPAPPVITSATTATGQVAVAFSYQITATNNPTSYNASGLPSGLTVNTSTGVISGTPTTAGTYSVTVSATNSGGTGSATLTFTISPPPPVITSSKTPAGQACIAFSYTIMATNNPTSYGASGLPSFLSISGNTISGTPTAPGTYTFTVSATNAGGTGTATVTLTVASPPTPSITSPSTATGTVGVAFSYNITANTCVTSYNATGLPSGLSVNTSTGVISGTPTAGTDAGSPYSVTISATNAGGTGSATLTLTIKPQPPVITSALTATGQTGAAFSYTITATNSPISYGATGLPAGLSVNTSTGVISGTPTTVGTYSVTISATNAGGTGMATLTLTIKLGPPVITSATTATGYVGIVFSYQITATNNPTSFNATGLPSGLTVNTSTGLISGTPAAGTDAGSPYSVAISATNSAGTGSATLTLTITLPPPVITSAPTASGTVGTAFSYQITATNNPTSFNAVIFNTTTLPAGLTVNTSTGLISGTPTTADIYQLTISATNAYATGSATLVITIGPFNAIGTQGVTYTSSTPLYQIPATGTPASYNATGLPGGLTVNTTTGVISGTPATVGTSVVTIGATYGTGASAVTGSGTLILAITGAAGPAPTLPGQPTDIDTNSSSPPPNNSAITFPNTSTTNSFKLYWNSSTQVVDQPSGGLTRNPTANSSPIAMQLQSLTTGTTSTPSLNVWRGNPSPPNPSPSPNTSGQFGDPRASWYITDPWPAANYLTSSYWGGPTPQFLPLNWPDSGHNSSPGMTPSGLGQYPDAVAKAAPTPDPNKWISYLSKSGTGTLASMAELGNVLDPAQLSYTVTNPGGALPDIQSATPNSKAGGGYTLAIGRPEFSMFNQNGMRAWQLLDVFSADNNTTTTTAAPINTAGRVNLNTASSNVLRALAAGILQNRDAVIQPASLQNSLYPPTVSSQADLFANAVINSRPLLSTAALSAITVTPPGGSTPEPFFGNPDQYNNQTAPTQWNDAGREELFSKILNLVTTRSRNFRVFVTGQSLDKNGNVLSTVTKVYHVFVEPTRGPNTGGITSQQVVIKYEGSM